jgi:hypothetical protein
MTIPKFLITFCIILHCGILSARKKSFTGYYITTKGDTIKGNFPQYAQWGKNPGTVEFIAAGSTTAIFLSPVNCKDFAVKGYDTYVSYNGNRLANLIDDNVLLDNKFFIGSEEVYENTSVFLRLVTGTPEADLYVLNDKKRINFFYQLPQQPITELKYRKTISQNQIAEVNDYKKQLTAAFANTILQAGLTVKLEELTYTESSLSSFFREMFLPKNGEAKQPAVRASWVASIGASINMINIKSVDNSDIPESYQPTIAPLISIGCRVPIDRNFGRYFIYPQLRLYNYKNTAEENQGTFIKSVTYKASLLAGIDMNGGVNIINHDKFSFFITGGIGLLMQAGGEEVTRLFAASDHSPYGSPKQIKLPAFTYSINTSTGAIFNNKISVSAAYILPTPVADFANYTAWLSGIQCKVGYIF